MLKNKYFNILIAVLIIFILVYAIAWYLQYRENSIIFEMVETIDHSGTEKQVIEKIICNLESVKENPDSAENWGRLGMNLYIHNYKNESIHYFQKAYSIDETDFRWPYFCAIALDELNSDKAIEWYKISSTLTTDYPPLSLQLGNRYLLNGMLDEASMCFNDVIKSGLKVPHAHLGLAKIAIERADLDEAENQLEKAIMMAPEYREAHALLADVYRRGGDRLKAEHQFEIMKKLPERLDLDDPIYYQMVEEGVSSFWCQVRGNLNFKSGKFNIAENEFRKALAAKPNKGTFTSLGSVYQKQKRYELAMDQYQSALDLDSNHIGALNNLAVIFYDLGDVNEAIRIIRLSLEIDPGSIDSYLNLGTFLKNSGQRKEALKYFRQGMELAPLDMRFVYQVSWLLAAAPEKTIRNGKESLCLAEELCEYKKYKTAKTFDLLAAALAEDRQFTKAIRTAKKAHRLAVKSNNKILAENISARIRLYKEHKPYREK